MAKVIWLGEDTEDVPGPSFNTWCGVKFPKGVAVEVTDLAMIAKARGNQFYKVIEGRAPEPPKQEVLRKEEAEQYDTSGARDITPKQERQDAQEKTLERKAQELKSKIENKKEAYDYRKAEKVSGYSPVKKKAAKEKAASRTADNADA